MALDIETLKHLQQVKEEIEEILSEVGDILPPEFRMTCCLRYVGNESDVDNMIWSDDAFEDIVGALRKQHEAGAL